MKKFRNLSAFVVLFTALSFISCETEPVDSALVNQNPEENPDTDPGTNPGTENGIYWPLALGNEWVFDRDGVEELVTVGSTTTIEGQQYFKFNEFFNAEAGGTATTFIRNEGGNYKVRVQANVQGTQVTDLNYTILKENLTVGQTWVENFTQIATVPGFGEIPTDITITGEMLERNISLTVNGVTYNDVIHLNVELVGVTMGMVNTANTEYWYAKNIGMIKVVQVGLGTGGGDRVLTLESYSLN